MLSGKVFVSINIFVDYKIKLVKILVVFVKTTIFAGEWLPILRTQL